MKIRALRLILLFLSLVSITAAGALFFVQRGRYEAARAVYPAGLVIADVPVGGLTREQAKQRLEQAYLETPVELRYGEARIALSPREAGFELQTDLMLQAADLNSAPASYWGGFWDFLSNRSSSQPNAVGLLSFLKADTLRAYLREQVAARYDQPAQGAALIPNTVRFSAAQSGSSLDVEAAIPAIETALRSLSSRSVQLNAKTVDPSGQDIQTLKLLMQQIVEQYGYGGVLEVFVQDLKSENKIQLAMDKGKEIAPVVTFTAASTIKIPIMISIFRRQPDPLPGDIASMLTSMLELSDNQMSDELMQTLDKNLGPILVTKDMQALGLKNTFMGGYFYPGAPLLDRFETPANLRKDVYTSPDAYNQTTPSDMGILLQGIYACAKDGSGLLTSTFKGELTQSKCQQMVDFLVKNRNGSLLEAGVPEGTRLAHKHGWTVEADGLMHAVSDTGIVYAPQGGNDYLISIYVYNTEQINWELTNNMMSTLSEAAYNYFNR
jgi:beta-lactamase class A